jgi:hypothetical protein
MLSNNIKTHTFMVAQLSYMVGKSTETEIKHDEQHYI